MAFNWCSSSANSAGSPFVLLVALKSEYQQKTLTPVRVLCPRWWCSAPLVTSLPVCCCRDFKGLHVLVNNAGVSGPTTPAQELVKFWESVVAVNLHGISRRPSAIPFYSSKSDAASS
jgi:hypothetical protein